MIPKIIHCCWFGGPKTKLAEKCIASWRKFAPSFEIIEWSAHPEDSKLTPAFWSDRERFRALYKEGGIYFDTDVELVAAIDDLTHYEWCSKEWMPDKSTIVNPGSGIALEKGSPIAKAMLDYYDANGLDYGITVGEILSKVLLNTGYALQTLQPEIFSPIDCAGKMHRTEETRGIHHYAMSWAPWWRKCLQWISWHGGRPLINSLVFLKHLISRKGSQK